MLAQRDCEVIVVDYGCPQNSGTWVQDNHPQVKVVTVADDPGFCAARARNAGAAAATADWLAFVDADILLSAEFASLVTSGLAAGSYYINDAGTWDSYGTCICRKADFVRIDGYDEVFGRLRGEDEDFYFRLRDAGVRHNSFPGYLLSPIQHDDTLRGLSGLGERLAAQRASTLYIQGKRDMAKLNGEPDRATRKKLLAAAMEGIAGLGEENAFVPTRHTLSVEMPLGFPNLDFFGLRLSRKITYTLDLPEGAPMDAIRKRVSAA
jgi:glycosyltransferase involved in cell wall biosynthesis